MAEFRWIIMSSFLMLLFSCREAAVSYVTVRVGDEATLPCGNVIQDQNKCDGITWRFYRTGVILFDRGQIHKDKSDRLSVTKQCSLVIKKVTEQDAGRYDCRHRTGDELIYLFVVSMTEQKNADTVSLLCSVLPHDLCGHTVKWLHEGKDVTDTSQHNCSARATFTTSDFNLKSKNESLKCEATNRYNEEVHLFPFSPPQSTEKPGDDATTITTITTIEIQTTTRTTAIQSSSTTRNKSENNNDGGKQQGWWRFIYVPLGLAALITTVVAVNMWTRTKGNKTQTEENTQHNDEDEDEGTVTYENVGEPSVSVRLH